MPPIPTTIPAGSAPGFYVQQVDISTPNVPQGTFIPGIVGQGAKTMLRSNTLVKGASGGQDALVAPAPGLVINITNVIDANGFKYTQGRDYQLSRPTPTTAVVDWSLLAQLLGTADLTLLTYPTQLDGLHFNITLNGVVQDIVFTLPAGPADVVSQINAWVGMSIASLAPSAANPSGPANFLLLQAKSIGVNTSGAQGLLGFAYSSNNTGPITVFEPATGLNYTTQFLSDRLLSEYAPQLFSNMNSLIANCGSLQTQQEFYSGNALPGATATTLPTGLNLSPNANSNGLTPYDLNGYYVTIVAGTGQGQVRVIIGNTQGANSVLTISQPWTAYNTPDATSQFVITDVNNNSVVLGAQTAFDAGATFIITSQYADNLFDVNNIQAAISALSKPVSGQFAYCIVLMQGLGANELTPLNYLKTFVDQYSGIPYNQYCMTIIGLAQGNDDYTTFTQMAQGTEDRRVSIVDISTIYKDFGDGHGPVALDGSYVAAAVAGVVCANVDAGTPITYQSVGAVFDIDTFVDPFLVTEKNQMRIAGVTLVERIGTDLLITWALTTDNTDVFTQEMKLTRSADYISLYLKSNLQNVLTGKRLVVSPSGQNDIVLLAQSMFSTLLNNLKNPQAQIITDAQNVSVTQDATNPRQLNFFANIYLTTDVIYEYALLGFSV